MTETIEDRGIELPPAEMTVAAVIDAVREFTSSPGVHRTTMQALLDAARERAQLEDIGVADREDLADALNLLRRLELATLDDRGFSLTTAGEERVQNCVKNSGAFRDLREALETLVDQKFSEWELHQG